MRQGIGGGIPSRRGTDDIAKTDRALWGFLKSINFIPSFAKSVVHELRNGITLCDTHHSDFDGYRFFIRWVPSVHAFVFVNFDRSPYLEQFHGKKVVLDSNQTTATARFLLHSSPRRCAAGGFTLGALTGQSSIHYLPPILTPTIVKWEI